MRDKWRHESQAETPSVVSTRRCRRRRRSTHAMRSFKSMPPWLFLKSEREKKKKKSNSNSSLFLHIIELRVVCRWNENEWERMLLSHAHFANIWAMLLEIAKSIFGLDWGERIEWGKKWSCRGQKNTQLTIGVCENLHLWTFGEHREENSLCRFKLTHYWRRAKNEVVAVVSPIIPWQRNESRALKRRHFRAKSAGRDKWQSTDSFHVAFLFGHFSCIWGLKFPGIIQGDLIARTAWMDDDDDDENDGQKERINELRLTCAARDFAISSWKAFTWHSDTALIVCMPFISLVCWISLSLLNDKSQPRFRCHLYAYAKSYTHFRFHSLKRASLKRRKIFNIEAAEICDLCWLFLPQRNIIRVCRTRRKS